MAGRKRTCTPKSTPQKFRFVAQQPGSDASGGNGPSSMGSAAKLKRSTPSKKLSTPSPSKAVKKLNFVDDLPGSEKLHTPLAKHGRQFNIADNKPYASHASSPMLPAGLSSPPDLQHSSNSFFEPSSSPAIATPQTATRSLHHVLSLDSGSSPVLKFNLENSLLHSKFTNNENSMTLMHNSSLQQQSPLVLSRQSRQDVISRSPSPSPSKPRRSLLTRSHTGYGNNTMKDVLDTPVKRTRSDTHLCSSRSKRMKLVINNKGRAEISYLDSESVPSEEEESPIARSRFQMRHHAGFEFASNSEHLDCFDRDGDDNNDDDVVDDDTGDSSNSDDGGVSKTALSSSFKYNEAAAAFAQTLARSRTKTVSLQQVERQSSFHEGFTTQTKKLEDSFTFKYASPTTSPIVSSSDRHSAFNYESVLATPPSGIMRDDVSYNTGMTPYLPSARF